MEQVFEVLVVVAQFCGSTLGFGTQRGSISESTILETGHHDGHGVCKANQGKRPILFHRVVSLSGFGRQKETESKEAMLASLLEPNSL